MVHAVLHPPGSTSVGEYETPVEERLAQHVANRTCEHFSVGDYMDFVELYGLGDAYIDDEECNGVELLLAALIETLEKPDDVPRGWAGQQQFRHHFTRTAWAESIGVRAIRPLFLSHLGHFLAKDRVRRIERSRVGDCRWHVVLVMAISPLTAWTWVGFSQCSNHAAKVNRSRVWKPVENSVELGHVAGRSSIHSASQ